MAMGKMQKAKCVTMMISLHQTVTVAIMQFTHTPHVATQW